MQFIVPVLKWILPYLVKEAEKYLPQLLDSLFIKLMSKRKKEITKMASVKFLVKDTDGKVVPNINISYKVGGMLVTPKVTDVNGEASTSGLPVGVYDFTASGNGYDAVTNKAVSVTEEVVGTVAFVLKAQNSTVKNVESNIQKTIENIVSNSTSTPSQDWKTIKSAATDAITNLSNIITTGNLDESTIIGQAYGLVTEAIHKSLNAVEEYKSQLMISRHTTGLGECLLIDLKLVGITLFQTWASKEVETLLSKLKERISIK